MKKSKYHFNIKTPIMHGEKFGVSGKAVGLSVYKLQHFASEGITDLNVNIKYIGECTIKLDTLRMYTKSNPLAHDVRKGTPLKIFPISLFTIKDSF